MARIEWVALRLNNWALWSVREKAGGLGFSTQSVLLADTSGSDRYRESIIPVDDIDAGVTNTAVESLKLPRSDLYRTLHHIYPDGLGIKEAARREACAVSTINDRLQRADRALSDWFTNRQQAQENRKEKSFLT